MPTRRTNICLNMIVKNETAVLERLFSSVRDYIDYYVIVDTGSEDGTPEFITEWMDKAGIQGEVHHREWVNFGHNRQQALDLAIDADKCDWLLFIDADEELGASDPEFFKKLEPGVNYGIEKHHSGARYTLPHLVNIRSTKWEWRGPVHNYLTGPDGNNPAYEFLDDIWIIYHPNEGAKSHGVTTEEKYLRDAAIFEEELVKNPEDTRSQFYLGQSYKHAGHFEQAEKAYRKRLTMEGYDEERYLSQLELGRIAIQLEKPESSILQEYLDAFELRPTRAEPLFELAYYFRAREQYAWGYTFAKTGSQILRPVDNLFVMQSIYDWRMLDEFAICAYWIGRYDESKEACEKILSRVNGGLKLTDEQLERVRKNWTYAFNQLK